MNSFWQTSSHSSRSVSPIKARIQNHGNEALAPLRRSSRSRPDGSTSYIEPKDEALDSESEDEAGEPGDHDEAARLEQKRAKNRVKQRNLRRKSHCRP